MKYIKISLYSILLLFPLLSYTQVTGNDCNCIKIKLEPEQEYVLSAWAKEDGYEQKISYSNPRIEIKFYDQQSNLLEEYSFFPSGSIIEGWQKISQKFVVPIGYTRIEFILKSNDVSSAVFFDDIRIQPFNSSLKSFVYDPVSLRLMAELDENNYATLYEYDKEGGLIRVKKETERGFYTIQETRSKNSISD
ncbi:carbohydrate binding domain-containing protein [Aequorivita antarctica]|uniref:Uncharacterized protein n=1 Tax=Aequorivita antarctica TaxID=153266 RepID=A0A5C6YYL4_9FLAO|nr:hypothetical protein [Aequorivita antarctica]TXD72818.1 hypothetical protein ESU54_11420 [Aequorivita antarctica]SRX75247.1 hypothetical protein AEQU3_02241 [Aequorivita antarctica]